MWCEKWRLEVNLAKTNILHIRSKRKMQSRFVFIFNRRPVSYCQFYKYLGCYINEHLDYNYTSEMQSDSAGRALSSIITKLIKDKGFPFSVYSTLYQACVCSISQYGAEVYGFKQYDGAFKLHLRAARAFLGLPKNVASFGLVSELDWLLPHFQSQVKMIQHFSRIMCTPSNRLMYRIYAWDRNLNESQKINTWSSEVKSILNENGLNFVFENQQIFSSKKIVSELKLSMIKKQQEILKIECGNKPKLRTFMRFKDFQTLPPHVGKPLSFVERKTISKLRLGILPLRIETARYTRPIIPENQRVCYCNSGEVESEYYVLFKCSMYNKQRRSWLNKLLLPADFLDLDETEKLKIVLNKAENVKHTAQYLVSVMDLRCQLNKVY